MFDCSILHATCPIIHSTPINTPIHSTPLQITPLLLCSYCSNLIVLLFCWSPGGTTRYELTLNAMM